MRPVCCAVCPYAVLEILFQLRRFFQSINKQIGGPSIYIYTIYRDDHTHIHICYGIELGRDGLALVLHFVCILPCRLSH